MHLRLTRRATAAPLPEVEIVDMTGQRGLLGKRAIGTTLAAEAREVSGARRQSAPLRQPERLCRVAPVPQLWIRAALPTLRRVAGGSCRRSFDALPRLRRRISNPGALPKMQSGGLTAVRFWHAAYRRRGERTFSERARCAHGLGQHRSAGSARKAVERLRKPRRHLDWHANDRQGARLSIGHARRCSGRGPRLTSARLPCCRANLRAAHASGRTSRTSRARQLRRRADLRARALCYSARRTTRLHCICRKGTGRPARVDTIRRLAESRTLSSPVWARQALRTELASSQRHLRAAAQDVEVLGPAPDVLAKGARRVSRSNRRQVSNRRGSARGVCRCTTATTSGRRSFDRYC